MKVNFDLFKDIHFGFGNGLGFSKGEIFIDWLNELISRKADDITKKKLNFEDLEKELVIITTNIETFSTQEFSKHTTPKFEIAKSIRISSGMPGLMPLYEFNETYLADGDLQKASPMWKLSETLNNSNSRIIEFRLEGDCGVDNKNPISFINTIYSCVTEVATGFVTDMYGLNDRYDCIRINTGNIFFADLNLDKDSRRKLIESGYRQTMEYFKNFLPNKKAPLVKVYTKILKYIKQVKKGLKIHNVEEVQWWIGDLFIELCENKEIIDPIIYNKLVSLKNNLYESITTILFFHTRFKNIKALENETKNIIKLLEERLTELQLYIESYANTDEKD
jgi:hypothetical protein